MFPKSENSSIFQPLWAIFKYFSRRILVFKDFSRQPFIFKYLSSLCEPWRNLHLQGFGLSMTQTNLLSYRLARKLKWYMKQVYFNIVLYNKLLTKALIRLCGTPLFVCMQQTQVLSLLKSTKWLLLDVMLTTRNQVIC